MTSQYKYIEYANKTFKDKALELVLKNIELFYEDIEIEHIKKYNIGDDVKLSKGTFLHGISGLLDNFDWILENGFIAIDFTGKSEGKNKIKNSIGMWNIQNDILLKDYINSYSGITITYTIGRGPGAKKVSELVPFHKFDEYTEQINNNDEIWTYWGEKTKEVTFLPSLVSNKRQIAFILDMESDYAQKLASADVWNTKLDEETLIEFLDYRYYPEFINLRFEKNATTTDRESAIIFGLPSKLIEGVLVGRTIEQNKESLNYIKSKLPNCYICNLDGKVIVE
ncbi:MAG TPA: hypothetical protein DCE23_05185 [Firmicutes bacterium]|nr:hypothetical protein [Bacillota bacterium]